MEENKPQEPNKPSPKVTKVTKADIVARQTLPERAKHFFEDFRKLFSLEIDTDEAGTIENIQKSIEFRGGNLWGLIFAAFIASIGLNVNSGAVVIGAMLISPLMGPIVGTGFAIATNDFDTLKYAMRNLALFIIVSIVASTIYFGLSPIKTLTDQLEARTYPTFYDVLIAICGGAIGIVASSRSDRGNAIPGVAIATALMPPLCTVGYGIATFHWEYAAGAFYLFFINSVFIAGTAFLFVSALKFPHKEFLDPVREQKYKTIMVVIVVVTIIPSIYTAYNVVKQELFNSRVAVFSKKAKAYPLEKGLMVGLPAPDYRQDTATIELTVMGGVTKRDKEYLLNEMKAAGLANAKLLIREGSGIDVESVVKEIADIKSSFSALKDEHSTLVSDLYTNNKDLLQSKIREIDSLKKIIAVVNVKTARSNKPIGDIAMAFSALFPQATEIAYSELVKMNTKENRLDTLPTIILNWSGRRGVGTEEKERMSNFFRASMKLDTVDIIVY